MNTVPVPEQGQLIQVRNRFFIVQDIDLHIDRDTQNHTHKLSLECIDDDRLGETFDLIWELEVNKSVHTDIGFPKPEKWDSLPLFEAYTNAITWSFSSLIEGPPLKSPFMGAIEIEEYQFEPVVRALTMPRVNLLIADDVGLGKTIEAGLVVQELLARQRIRRIMIVCPASLMKQWQEEMLEKFNLEFRIIDRDAIFRLRKEYGIRVNPWNSYPRLITSMDFLKREQNLGSFKNSLNPETKKAGLKDWDLLIIDEAHNLAPAGRKEYIKDSDRTKMGREIVSDFENRLFLTATPHNGYTYSFTALLEMLDPLRFSRGQSFDLKQRDLVMIRRLKDDIIKEGASKKFAARNVPKITVDLPSDDEHPERKLFKYFELYRESRLGRTQKKRELLPIRFALTLLKKRLLSSPLAFYKSLEVHLNNITKPGEIVPHEKQKDEVLFSNLHRKSKEDWDDDTEKATYEEQALQESTKFFGELTPEEDKYLTILWEISSNLQDKPDTKAKELINWIKQHMFDGDKWNNERLIIFTEYKDTLNYLRNLLEKIDRNDRILTLIGGMSAKDRQQIKSAFQTSPKENPVRILLATDAASEGLNLQNHCRYLIHYEIPWNPNKMEQRNGRIDRYGQSYPEVFCHHFYYTNHADSDYLQLIINKMQTQREDMGGVGELIEREVEQRMLGESKPYSYSEHRIKTVREETKAYTKLSQDIQKVRNQIKEARESLHYTPERIKQVVEQAISISLGKSYNLEEIQISNGYKVYLLRTSDIPEDWHDVKKALKDAKGRIRPIIFDPDDLKERKNVSLIHMNHPLLKRALGIFRSNMWSTSLTSGKEIQRVSYKVVSDGDLHKPLIVGIGRIVVINTYGQKLHEQLVKVGGYFSESQLEPLPIYEIQKLITSDGDQQQIPRELAGKLRMWFPSHKQILHRELDLLAESEQDRIKQLLFERAEKESEQIKNLINERIEEIRSRIKTDKRKKDLGQLPLDFEEEQQFEEDMKWLERRLDQLATERKERPAQIKKQYIVKHIQTYSTGLLYLIPETLVKKWQ